MPAHTELTWILNCVATFGELRRMTQFKEKCEGQESVSVGLFDYPVLMAADILAYDTDKVPVGDDQRQHVELARDVAIRFNHRFGDTLVVPESHDPAGRRPGHGPPGPDVEDVEVGRLVAGHDRAARRPEGRSPRSDQERGHRLRDRGALRPGGEARRLEPARRSSAATTGRPIPALEAEFAGAGYGTLKTAVADAVVEFLRPLQERYAELSADPAEVDAHLAAGADKAEAIATKVLERVRRAAGLLPRGR